MYGAGGFYVLTPLAALLGAALISRESSSGGIFFILSKPISRARLLLTKYFVCAGVLLAAALLGGLLIGILAAVYGYPVGQLEPASVVLSALLMWTGVLSALSIALLASVVFDDVVKSLVATAVATFLVFVFPVALGIPDRSWLPYYWIGWSLGANEGPLLTNFGICLVAAAVPLVAALWLFNRKAY